MSSVIRTRKPLKEFVRLSELEKTKGWLDIKSGNVIPFDQLSEKALKAAIVDAEAKELRYHNKSSFFAELAGKLLDEAERRGIEVEHLNTEFTVKNVSDRYKPAADGNQG